MTKSSPPLSRNTALYLANADGTEEKIGRSLPFEPFNNQRIALPLAASGSYHSTCELRGAGAR